MHGVQIPPNRVGARTRSPFVKMLLRINRDLTASHDPCGSSFLLVSALRLA